MKITHWELSAATRLQISAEHEKAIKLSVLKILAPQMQPAWPCPQWLRSQNSESSAQSYAG